MNNKLFKYFLFPLSKKSRHLLIACIDLFLNPGFDLTFKPTHRSQAQADRFGKPLETDELIDRGLAQASDGKNVFKSQYAHDVNSDVYDIGLLSSSLLGI